MPKGFENFHKEYQLGRLSLPPIVGGILIGLLFGLVNVFFGKGYFLYVAQNLIVSTFLGIPVLAGLVFGYVKWKLRQREKHRVTFSVFLGLLIGIILQLLILPLGHLEYQRQVNNTKKYCESLIPCLEDFKSLNGHYPMDIESCEGGNRPEGLLVSSKFYYGQKDHFAFDFRDKSSPMGSFVFSSQKMRWE